MFVWMHDALVPIGHISSDIYHKAALKLTETPQSWKLAGWPQTKVAVLVNAQLLTDTVEHGSIGDSPSNPVQV